MKLVTETAAEYPSPRFEEAELNARSPKAADRETSNEKRTACTMPPPLF